MKGFRSIKKIERSKRISGRIMGWQNGVICSASSVFHGKARKNKLEGVLNEYRKD